VKRTTVGSLVAFGVIIFSTASNATDVSVLAPLSTRFTTQYLNQPAWQSFQGGYTISNSEFPDASYSWSFSGQSPPPYASYTSSALTDAGFGYSQSVFSSTPSPGIGSAVSAQVFPALPSNPSDNGFCWGGDIDLAGWKCGSGGVQAVNTTSQIYFFEIVPRPVLPSSFPPGGVPVPGPVSVPIQVQITGSQKIVFTTYVDTNNSLPIVTQAGQLPIAIASADTSIWSTGVGAAQIPEGQIADYQIPEQDYFNSATNSSTTITKSFSGTLSLYTNEIYAISQSTEAYASSLYFSWKSTVGQQDTGYSGYHTTAAALADPYLVIDPSNPNAGQYQILLSQGFGNSPLAGAPSPAPGAGLVSLAFLAFLGAMMKWREKATRLIMRDRNRRGVCGEPA
jgi:hypothetical protein